MKLFTAAHWYRGNLHTHTTRSDGTITPEQCAELYRSHGYDFLAITDHLLHAPGGMYEDLLLLPGAEYHYSNADNSYTCHIVALGCDKQVDTTGLRPQQIIDAIRAAGGLAILAHPAWSIMRHEDVLALRGCCGLEIWNTISEAYSGRGDSQNYADVLMHAGQAPLLFASDDAHFYDHDHLGGWVMLNADALDTQTVLHALCAGDFYATQGPRIEQIELGDGRVHVRCSPVRSIRFISTDFWNSRRTVRSAQADLTEATYTADGKPFYICCEDEQGRRAWSRIITAQMQAG